jgi:hypothetical protein
LHAPPGKEATGTASARTGWKARNQPSLRIAILRPVHKKETPHPRLALSYRLLLTAGAVAMALTVSELLARKQQLLERLQEERPDLNEQDEIERLLVNINAMLDRLEQQPIKAPATRH